jgi:iron complex transport system substrate-binding protein
VAGAQAVSVLDLRGKRINLPSPPKRIVSLSPAVTELLFAVGAGDRLVGVTSYCDYPDAAKRLPKIGDVNTSYEKVIALRPELVVAGKSANSRAIVELEKRGVRVFAVDAITFRELFRAIRMTGAVTGHSAEAEKLAKRLEQETTLIHRQVEGRAHPAVVTVIQSDPLMVAGKGTFIDDLIEQAGGSNVGRSAGEGYPTFSAELLLAHPPDFLLAGGETARRIKDHPALGKLKAVTTGKVFSLGLEAARPGPRLVTILRKLASMLHPDAFKKL